MSQESAIHVEINLDKLVEVLKIGVRRTAAFMGLGVNAALDPEFKSVELPTNVSNIRLLPEIISDELLANIKDEFKLWIEANGFRELCETLEQYLTGIYRCAMLASKSNGGRIPSETLIEIPKKFEREGLRTKLQMLRDDYRIAPAHLDHLASLWDARNCLTHRRGIVGEKDLDDSGHLTVKWLGMDTLFIDHKGNETLLGVGFEEFHTGEGGDLALRFTERVKQFSLGERAAFSAHDLAEICWFCLMQSDEIVKALLVFMDTKGIPRGSAQAQKDDAPSSQDAAGTKEAP